jgi:hypothetical protein
MSEDTPKFCSYIQDNSFTTESAVVKSKKGGERKKKKKIKRFSLENIENNKHRKISLSKLIKEREKEIKKKNRKRNKSQLYNMCKFNIKNVNIFMLKHKFKLRNDFDKKNSEKFLLSKEQAFENPFLLYN